MLIDNIGNTCDRVYNNILIFKKKLKNGGADGSTQNISTICSEITDIYTNLKNFNKDKLIDFKNNVNSKYFKDQ